VNLFFKNKLVLVTGGTGFVGGHFVERLLELGAHIRIPVHNRPLLINDARIEAVSADLMNQDDCMKVCEGVDSVIHAAGSVSGAGTTGVKNPMEAIGVNLNLSVQILQAAWACNVDRFLLFSSSAAYPEATHPVKEEELWAGSPHPSYFGYGWLRRYLEKMGEFVHANSNTKIALVRPTAIYGERDDFDPVTSHVLSALIRRAVEKENPFKVWGSPDVVRDFLHVKDLIEGALLLLAKHPQCDPVNIGYGQGITIGEVVQIILGKTRLDVEVIYDVSKPMTIPFRAVDITKAKKILEFEPSISIEEGIERTINWYKLNK
jgi:GDP-L-fucose synthase